MKPSLQPLPKPLVDRIRTAVTVSTVPQAVVELLCNSLDAEARTVLIKLNAATLSFSVEDDGWGMCSEDLDLMGTRYHTSKLRSMTDYAAGLLTLGFRGEATSGLVSITAELAVTSRARGRFETLSKMVRNGGAETRSGPSAVALTHCGTVVVAKRLLFNQPVRQRQLAAQPRETEAATIQAVLRTALPFTATAVTLLREGSGQVLLHLPKGRDIGALFLQLCPEQPAATLPWLTTSAPGPPAHSSATAAAVAAVGPCRAPAASAAAHSSSVSGAGSSGGTYTVRALLGNPAAAYPQPQHQFVYVNRRHVRHPQLAALLNAHFLRAHLKAGHHLLGAARGGGGAAAAGGGGTCGGAGSAAGAGGPVRTSCVRAFPAFLVCIECPPSHYDVMSEPDKSDLVFRHLPLVSGLLRQLAVQAWGGGDGSDAGEAVERAEERGSGAAAAAGDVGQAAAALAAAASGPGSSAEAGRDSAARLRLERNQKQGTPGVGVRFAYASGGDGTSAACGALAEEASPTMSAALAALNASEATSRSKAAAAAGAPDESLQQLPGAAAAAAAEGPLRALLQLQSAGRAAGVGMQSKSLSIAALGVSTAAEAREACCGGSADAGQLGGLAFGTHADAGGNATPPPTTSASAATMHNGHLSVRASPEPSPLDVSPGDVYGDDMVHAHPQRQQTARLTDPVDLSPLPDISPGLPWENAPGFCGGGVAAAAQSQAAIASDEIRSGRSLPPVHFGKSVPPPDFGADSEDRARPTSDSSPGDDCDAFGSPMADSGSCGTAVTGNLWRTDGARDCALDRWALGDLSSDSPPKRAYVSPLAWSYDTSEDLAADKALAPTARSRLPRAVSQQDTDSAANRWDVPGYPHQGSPSSWDEEAMLPPQQAAADDADLSPTLTHVACHAPARLRSPAAGTGPGGTPTGDEETEELLAWRNGVIGDRSSSRARSNAVAAGLGIVTPSDMQQALDAAFPIHEDDRGGGGSCEEGTGAAAAPPVAYANAMRPDARQRAANAGDMSSFLRSLCEQPELASAAGGGKGHALNRRRTDRPGSAAVAGPVAATCRAVGPPHPSPLGPAAEVSGVFKPPEVEGLQKQRPQMPVLVGVPVAPSPHQEQPSALMATAVATSTAGAAAANYQSHQEREGAASGQDGTGPGASLVTQAQEHQAESSDSLSPLARFLSFGNVTGGAVTPEAAPPVQLAPSPRPAAVLSGAPGPEDTSPPSPAVTSITPQGTSAAAAAGTGAGLDAAAESAAAAASSAATAPGRKLLAQTGCSTPDIRQARSPSQRLVQSAPPHAKKRARSVHGNPGASLSSALADTGTQHRLTACSVRTRCARDAAPTGAAALPGGGSDEPDSAHYSTGSGTSGAVGAAPTAAGTPATQEAAAHASTALQATTRPRKPGAPKPVCTFFRAGAASSRRRTAAAAAAPSAARIDEPEAGGGRTQQAAVEQLGRKRSRVVVAGDLAIADPAADVSNAEPACAAHPAATASASVSSPGVTRDDGATRTPQPVASQPSVPPQPMLKRVVVQQQGDLVGSTEDGGSGIACTAAPAAAVQVGGTSSVRRLQQLSVSSQPSDGAGSEADNVYKAVAKAAATQPDAAPTGTLNERPRRTPASMRHAKQQRAARQAPAAQAPRSILKKPRPEPAPAIELLESPSHTCADATQQPQQQPQEPARPAKRVRWSLPDAVDAPAGSEEAAHEGGMSGTASPAVAFCKRRRASAGSGSGEARANTADTGRGPLASEASLHHGHQAGAARGLRASSDIGYTLLPEHDAAVAASAAAASSLGLDVGQPEPVPLPSSVAALLPSALGITGMAGGLPAAGNAFGSASPFARAAAAAAAASLTAAAPPASAVLPAATYRRAASPFAAAAVIAKAATSGGASQPPEATAAPVAVPAFTASAVAAPMTGLAALALPQPVPLAAPGVAPPQEPILDLERDLLRLQAPHERLVPAAVARSGLAAGETGGALRQVEGKFIPAVGTDGCLLIIDQHAAHERVRLEQLTQALALARESGAGSAGRPRAGGGSAGTALQRGPAASAAERVARVDALWVGSTPAAPLGGGAAAGQAGAAALPSADDMALLYSQQLSPAIPVRLTVQEAATAEKHLLALAEWGWQLAPAGLAPAAAGGSCAAVGGAILPPPQAAVLAPQEDTQQLLLAVPVVCGVALTPTDLRAYLGQLQETGGSRLPPPAVLRLLRSRSCRTAVMFGDPLSSSQCGRLLAALRATALWTQCAHGRPTAAPLVHLPTLRAVLGRRRNARDAIVAAAGATGGDQGGCSAGARMRGAGAQDGERDAKKRRVSVEALRAMVAAGRKDGIVLN